MTFSLDISDDRKFLRGDAYFQLEAACLFPDCPFSARQVATLLASEQRRLQQMPPEKREPSKIVAQLLAEASSKKSQIFMAGHIGFGLWCVEYVRGDATGHKAVEVAINVAMSYGKSATSASLHGNTRVEAKVAIPSSRSQLYEIFTQYRSVLHICAASVASSEYHELMPAFEPAPEFEKCFIQTATFFQGELGSVYQREQWPIADILSSYPQELVGYPALLSEKTLREQLTAYVRKYPKPRQQHIKT